MTSGSGILVTEDNAFQAPSPGEHLFCSGHAFDGYGRLVISGGHSCGNGVGENVNCGLKTVNVYDPLTNTMSNPGDMDDGRWYPTCIVDSLGDVYFISGNRFNNDLDCACGVNRSVERFVPFVPGISNDEVEMALADIGASQPDPLL